MKAMIFAAGLGTRLKPLTDSIPKALVEIGGKPLLAHAIEYVASFGFTEIIVNVHHFSTQVVDYLSVTKFNNVTIAISDETNELRNTGGGLVEASWFLNSSEPFLVYNVDIITNIDLQALYKQHCSSSAIATLAVSQRNTARYLLFNDDLHLLGWTNIKTNEVKNVVGDISNLKKLAFSGIQIVSPHIFSKIEECGNFSIIDAYLRLSNSNYIAGYNHTGAQWMDVGKLNELDSAEVFLRNLRN